MATTEPPGDCHGCPLSDRRSFLRSAALTLGSIMLGLGLTPDQARALPVRFAAPHAVDPDHVAYPIPAGDEVQIDRDNEVILVRHSNELYAFNLSCPHQHTALKWNQDDGQFQCPKHHSRYQPDGEFISGRATRSMDRFGLTRDGSNVVVHLDQYYRQDKEPGQWAGAVISLAS